MWRSFFLAAGITLVIVGAQCLVVERIQINTGKAEAAPVEQSRGLFRQRTAEVTKQRGGEIVPPDWAPWSLMGAGAVVMIYSFTIPRRVSG